MGTTFGFRHILFIHPGDFLTKKSKNIWATNGGNDGMRERWNEGMMDLGNDGLREQMEWYYHPIQKPGFYF